jgi:hypothetical protein
MISETYIYIISELFAGLCLINHGTPSSIAAGVIIMALTALVVLFGLFGSEIKAETSKSIDFYRR